MNLNIIYYFDGDDLTEIDLLDFLNAGETITYDDGNYVHSFNDQPAMTHHSSSGGTQKMYFNHGKKHRLTGPAHVCFDYEDTNYLNIYYINGKKLPKEDFEIESNRYNLLNDIY